jgi:hypothetical protein
LGIRNWGLGIRAKNVGDRRQEIGVGEKLTDSRIRKNMRKSIYNSSQLSQIIAIIPTSRISPNSSSFFLI